MEKEDDDINSWIKQWKDKIKLISNNIVAILIGALEKIHKFIYFNLTNLSKIEKYNN